MQTQQGRRCEIFRPDEAVTVSLPEDRAAPGGVTTLVFGRRTATVVTKQTKEIWKETPFQKIFVGRAETMLKSKSRGISTT